MCNMVATKLQPFVEQQDRCSRARQQCLRYQLGWLYNQDQKLAEAGQVPQHTFSRWSKYADRVRVCALPLSQHPALRLVWH
jgi:hypothetical protein